MSDADAAPPPLDHDDPATQRSLDFARFLVGCFRRRSHWLPIELVRAAQRENFDWIFLVGSPPVARLGLRIEERPIPWKPGQVARWYILTHPDALNDVIF